MRWLLTVAIVLLATALAVSAAAQSVPARTETRRALAVQFADGRTQYHLLQSSTGEFWTPMFPRVAGATTSRGGFPLAALDVAHSLDGQDLAVAVSLLYGSPHQRRIEVATVRVTAAAPVVVEQLRPFGVEPITLSIVSVPPSPLSPPSVTCASALLDITVEPVAPDIPAYRMVVVNRGTHGLLAFDFKAYRGDREALSGRRKPSRQQTLLQPDARTSFEMSVSATQTPGPDAFQTWQPFDCVVVSAVLWDDGTVEGDPALAASEHVLADGSRQQIARVLDLFRAIGDSTPAPTPAALRARVWVLPVNVSVEEAAALQAALPDPRLLPVDRVRSASQAGMQ